MGGMIEMHNIYPCLDLPHFKVKHVPGLFVRDRKEAALRMDTDPVVLDPFLMSGSGLNIRIQNQFKVFFKYLLVFNKCIVKYID